MSFFEYTVILYYKQLEDFETWTIEKKILTNLDFVLVSNSKQ